MRNGSADLNDASVAIEPTAGAPLTGERQRGTFRTMLGIASAGRASTLLETVNYLSGMLSEMCPIVVCVPRIEDAAGLAPRDDVELLIGPHGLTRQRNAILGTVVGKADLLIFLDDDFVPAPDFVTRMQNVFMQRPDIVIATGDVIADGILGQAVSMREAMEVIHACEARPERVTEVYNAYGCNMAVRLSTVSRHNIAFDEELPLYGWLEDVDFSRSMARYGKSVRVGGACGVHLGARSGRQPGVRLGYSQVANPAYLRKKGTMATPRALVQTGRNVIANISGYCLGDSSVDRRGRMRGNLIAFGDLLRGRASPSRIVELSPSPKRDFVAAPITTNQKEQV